MGEMVRALWLVAPEPLFRLCQGCLQESCFPVEWKETRLLVLLKSPDKPRAEPRSSSPIDFLLVLEKVLDAFLVARLCSVVIMGAGMC